MKYEISPYLRIKYFPYSLNPRETKDALILIFGLISVSYKIINKIKDTKHDRNINN